MKTHISKKRLLTLAQNDQSTLCITVDFGDGMKAQYPITNALEGQAIAEHYKQLNAQNHV